MSRRSGGIYKSDEELRALVGPGRVTAAALAAVRAAIAPGVTTLELDAIAERTIRGLGGVPNFSMEPGYRHTICASIDEQVVHGIPTDRALRPGDLVSIDCGADVGGWNGDAAFSVVLDDPARPEEVERKRRLASTTERALWAGIAALATARTLNDVAGAIEDVAGDYGIVDDYLGHGIGRSMHEEPPVFNYRIRGRTPAVKPGLVVAIEPLLTTGGGDTDVNDDDWTVVTADGSLAAHWEHSIAVHAGGIWVLTADDGGAARLASFGVIPTLPA